MNQRLDISIGPVQGFVAQSRRTRDLWGSSYLLSFLSAHAMRGVEESGGRIVRPVVEDDPLYRHVCGHRDGSAPWLGSLPNRFEAEVEGDATEMACAGVESLDAAWKKVCDAVWTSYVERASMAGDGTERIWDRQIRSFWEVTWTVGEKGAARSEFARRKHWRSHHPPEEPGDKCTVMHDLQELSGHVRSARRKAQDAFWDRLRHRLGVLDIRDNERLCAVALVKRLFPRIADEALGWKVERSRWPSTIHMGARTWIRRVEAAVPDLAREYADAVNRSAPDDVFSEQRLDIRNAPGAGRFSMLDANWFHRESVANKRLCPLKDDVQDHQLEKQIKTIHESRDRDGRPIGSPSLFYAMLLADGDRLGKLVGELEDGRVSSSLAEFTREVPAIVREQGGETIYAGGDDALAMLPVEGALSCAEKLSDHYGAAFGGHPAATLSAAVVFSHVRLPLRQTIESAHRLLDDVAKEKNGRNSLAVEVLKSGGSNCRWVTTWKRPHDGSSSAVDSLEGLADSLRSNAGEPGLSSSLLYRIRESLSTLCGSGPWRPGQWGAIPEEVDILALLRAEIGHSLSVRGDEITEPNAGELADLVWNMLKPSRRAIGDDAATERNQSEIGMDALMLARFLAEHEQWKDGR